MTIRVGLIGCGKYCSQAHASFLSECPNASIVALSNCVYPHEASERRKRFNIPYIFAEYDEMLNKVGLDAVVISTPHKQHFQQAYASLERGLHVLVDKPPACSVMEAHILADLADARRCCFLVASQRRYDPIFIGIRDKIKNGEIGALKLIEIHYGRSKSREFLSSWRNDPAQSGGGVLLDAGYHLIDNVLWLTSRRIQRAFGYLQANGSNVETCVFLTLELEEGVLVSISAHLEMFSGMVREEYGFYGSDGALLLHQISLSGYKPTTRFIADCKGDRRNEVIHRKYDLDRAPVQNFIHAILEGEAVISSGRESVETVRTLESIYKALSSS